MEELTTPPAVVEGVRTSDCFGSEHEKSPRRKKRRTEGSSRTYVVAVVY